MAVQDRTRLSPAEAAARDERSGPVIIQALDALLKLDLESLHATEMLLDYRQEQINAAMEASDNMMEYIVRLSEESGRNKRSMLDAVVALRNAYMEQSTKLATAANSVSRVAESKFEKAKAAAAGNKYATWQALADVAGAFDSDLTLARESAALPATLERMLEMATEAPHGSIDLRQITDVPKWMKEHGVPESIQAAVAPHIERGRSIKAQYTQAKLEIDNQHGLLNEAERALRNVSDTDPVSTRNVYEKYIAPHIESMKSNTDNLVAQANGFDNMREVVLAADKLAGELQSVKTQRERSDALWSLYMGKTRGPDDATARIIGSENFRQWAAMNGYENLGIVERDANGEIRNYLPSVEDKRAIELYNYQLRHPGKYGRGFAPGGGKFTRRYVRVTVEPNEDTLSQFRMADGSFAINPETGAYMTPDEVKKYLEQTVYAVQGEDGSAYIVKGSEAWKIGADGKPVSISIDELPAAPSAALLGPDGKPATAEQVLQFVNDPESIDLTADTDQRAPLDSIRYEKQAPTQPFTVEGELMAAHATESSRDGNVISVVTRGGNVVRIPPEKDKTTRVDILAGGPARTKLERQVERRAGGMDRRFGEAVTGGLPSEAELLSQSSNAVIYDMRGERMPPEPRSKARDRYGSAADKGGKGGKGSSRGGDLPIDLGGVPEVGTTPLTAEGGGFRDTEVKTIGTLDEGVTGPPGGRGAVEAAVANAPSRSGGAGAQEIASGMAGTEAGEKAAGALAAAGAAGMTFGERGEPKTIEEKRKAIRPSPATGEVYVVGDTAMGAPARTSTGALKTVEDRMRNEATRRLVEQGGSFTDHMDAVRREAALAGVGTPDRPEESPRDRMMRKLREERVARERAAAAANQPASEQEQ